METVGEDKGDGQHYYHANKSHTFESVIRLLHQLIVRADVQNVYQHFGN